MQVIGKDIGEALDEHYRAIERRVRVEAERELRVEPFEDAAFSNVRWLPDAVVIQLHNGVPTHALPHIFGVALEHVRQRLDLYPAVLRPPSAPANDPGGSLVRVALRECVLAPEADKALERFHLDQEWEIEQRHQALKELLRDQPEDWKRPGTLGNAFASLQYAKFALQHPPEMWDGLRKQVVEQNPAAAENGEGVLQMVRQHGFGSPGACLEALVAARDELGLQRVAVIEDRRTGRVL